jgi:3-methyladenine DNA glycosylase AlkC
MSSPRKGARRRDAIPAEVLAQLHAGTLETANLVEGLAIDFAELLRAVEPALEALAGTIDATAGITARMRQVGEGLLAHGGLALLERLAVHPADTVRGWVAYGYAALPDPTFADRLRRIRPLADDPHFGVREWAWLALRPALALEPLQALSALVPWTTEASANLRRFASEITRPRGVWCAHLPELRSMPLLGLPILEPLRSDPSRYVQDSVANWLNDAGKDHPAWVREVTARWTRESDTAMTQYIVRRATRSL